jgi:hypothetical protein
MPHLTFEYSPEMCMSFGLDCRTCICKSAATLACICLGLSAEGAVKVFFEIYPSIGCRPMADPFQLAYLEHSAAPAA